MKSKHRLNLLVTAPFRVVFQARCAGINFLHCKLLINLSECAGLRRQSSFPVINLFKAADTFFFFEFCILDKKPEQWVVAICACIIICL